MKEFVSHKKYVILDSAETFNLYNGFGSGDSVEYNPGRYVIRWDSSKMGKIVVDDIVKVQQTDIEIADVVRVSDNVVTVSNLDQIGSGKTAVILKRGTMTEGVLDLFGSLGISYDRIYGVCRNMLEHFFKGLDGKTVYFPAVLQGTHYSTGAIMQFHSIGFTTDEIDETSIYMRMKIKGDTYEEIYVVQANEDGSIMETAVDVTYHIAGYTEVDLKGYFAGFME